MVLRRILLAICVLSIGLMIPMRSSAQSTQAEGSVTLTYSNYYPETSAVVQNIHKPVLRDITEGTNGRVAFKEYWAGSLHSLPDGFKAASSGLTNLTQAYVFTSSGSFDLPHCDSLPFAFSNSVVGSVVMEELYPKYFKKEYEKQNVYLGFYPVLEYTGIISKKPIRTLEDLKGKKLYVPGGMLQTVYKALGATPTFIPPAECFNALQRGILDGLLYPAGLIIPQRYHELAKYFTNLPVSYGAIPFAMNKDAFNKMPKDLKASFYNRMRYGAYLMGKLYYDMDRKAIELMREKGVEIIEPTKEERARWVKATASVWDEYAAKYEGKGLPAKALINDLKALNAKYSAMSMDALGEHILKNPPHGVIDGF